MLSACSAAVAPVAGAWTTLDWRWPDAAVTIHLGDLCDSTRFPGTPGSCAGTPGNPNWRAEFLTAVSRWQAATKLFEFRTDPRRGQDGPGDCGTSKPNSAFFAETVCGSEFGSTTLAVAQTYRYTNGDALHTDVIFNAAHDWAAFDGRLATRPGKAEFRRVAVHELGHVLGLGHPPHDDAVMHDFIQDVIAPQPDDLNGVTQLYGAFETFAIDDQNGNGSRDLVTIRSRADATIRAELRDGGTGLRIRRLGFFDAGFRALDAALLRDHDRDGSAELAVLAARRSDGAPFVEVRNLSGAGRARRIGYSGGQRPIALAVLPDGDLDDIDELAVLSFRSADKSPVVEIRNAIGTPAQRRVVFDAWTDPWDLAVVEDADGDGVRELAVLLTSRATDQSYVQTRNAAGPAAARTVKATGGLRMRRLVAVGDADVNGIPDVAMIGAAGDTGRITAEIVNVRDAAARRRIRFVDGNALVEGVALGDPDGNGVPELGVLSRRSDGRAILEMVNAAGTVGRRSLAFANGYAPAGPLQRASDFDVSGIDEALALLAHPDGRLMIQSRELVRKGIRVLNVKTAP
jgi:hypothetical protein